MIDTTNNNVQKVFHPRKFIIGLLIISSLMAFAGLVSAYIVMRYDETRVWTSVDLPQIFIISTFVVFLSSFTIHYAYNLAKSKKIGQSKNLLIVTFLLGVLFGFLQYKGLFVDLRSEGHYWLGQSSTVSSTFVYTFAIIHIFHILLTMIVLIILLVKSFREEVYERNIITFHNSVVFWHFLGILWVFLYLFLYFSR